MPDLLFLAQRIPYPPDKGEKIRHLHILQHLRRSYDVHLGCLVDEPRDRQHIPTVRAMCADAHVAVLDRPRARIACLRGLLTGEALSVAFYRDAGLTAWVGRVLREVRPAAIVVCSSNMAPYVLGRERHGATCLVDLCDVDSEKWRAYAETGSGPMRRVHAREWRLTAALETRIARDCDWSTLVSEHEAELLRRLVPDRADRIRTVGNGVDHGYFDPAAAFESPPYDVGQANFVFTGTMDYPPNIDAVTWFADAILPALRRLLPEARFHIVGSNPTAAVTRLAGQPGVAVAGRVADVRPWLAHAVAVAPMRIARGIQNKVLEAMAMARPMVVTSGALEGIDATPGREVLLADTADAFADACRLAAGPAGPALGAAARARVLAGYVWAERLRALDPLLASPSLGLPSA